MPNMLPGSRGNDYRFVRHGGKVYVVYRVKIKGGKWINTTWRVSEGDYKALGIKPESIGRIPKRRFKQLNIFGDSSEIVHRGGGAGEHPFQKFVKELNERNPGASWLQDREFMETMLMGKAEGWSASELENQVKHTKWYQSRTDAQRQWELEMGKADRQASLKSIQQQMTDALGEIYGEGFDWTGLYEDKDLARRAKAIASGQYGDPSEGFQLWFSNQQRRASKIEGTAAWVTAQQEAEAQRAYMNRPEDIQEQIRQEAFEWLGPKGVPDDEALMRWSQDLASEVKSDGDWQQFLQGQATSLYPWLGPQERWQDRASSYKRILEENWGTGVDWDDPMLSKIGAVDDTGKATGEAASWDQFQQMARQDDRFWSSDLGRQEGAEIFALLNDTFRGVR